MPDHFHLLITPKGALEHAVQLIKGGFSYRAKKELGSSAEVWQRGFSDHRIRDAEDYDKHVHYIHLNPVKRLLCESPSEYRYSSAFPGWKLDPIPQWLKPPLGQALSGTAEAVPFQNNHTAGAPTEAVPFQNNHTAGAPTEVVPLQNNHTAGNTAETVAFQNTNDPDGTAEAMPLQTATINPNDFPLHR
jgi:hypothetical protein